MSHGDVTLNEIERERRLLEVLSEALELEGAARRQFIDEACAEDSALREELESMLGEESQPGLLDIPAVAHLSDTPTHTSDEGIPAPDTETPRRITPATIGPYRIVEVLGQGGMGTVYLAEQEKPVRRRVALKVISALHNLRQRQRFAAEGQALARLNHPNVAALYEVGTTDDEHPFVAMELVDGTSITTWCDEHTLGLRGRIELFIGVCAGVRHAHEKGILHRDIKPTNLLIQEVVARPCRLRAGRRHLSRTFPLRPWPMPLWSRARALQNLTALRYRRTRICPVTALWQRVKGVNRAKAQEVALMKTKSVSSGRAWCAFSTAGGIP